MTTPDPNVCPSCGAALPTDRTAGCPACGLRLIGADAVCLWQVDCELASLQEERERLLVRLHSPEVAEVPGTAAAVPDYGRSESVPSAGSFPAVPAPYVPPERRVLSGQQVILGLGAILLLGAASIFVIAVWLLVGLVGQAILLSAMIALAVAGSALATAKRLPAASETGAVIAVGLTLLGVNAAHQLGLAGLDDVRPGLYWPAALTVCGLLFAGFHRLMPRGSAETPLRPVATYVPAATLAFAIAPWTLMANGWFDSPGPRLATVAMMAGVMVLETAVGHLLTRSGRWHQIVVGILVCFLLADVGGYLLTAFVTAYSPDSTTLLRYVATGSILLLAVLVILGSTADVVRRVPIPELVEHRHWCAAVGVLGIVAVVPVVLLDVDYRVVVAISVVVGVALWWAVWRLPASLREASWWPVLGPLAAIVVLVECWTVLLGDHANHVARGFDAAAGTDAAPASIPVVALVIPAACLLVAALVWLARHRVPFALIPVSLTLALTAATALIDASALAGVIVTAALMVLHLLLAAAMARSTADGAQETELSCAVFAVGFGAAAVSFNASLDRPVIFALTLFAAAVVTAIYAGQPGRLLLAYAACALGTAGTWVLLDDRSVDTGTAIEAYTLPLAAMLAVVGAVQHHRARLTGTAAPSMLTVAPALAAALVPSMAVAIGGGDAVRLAAVTVVSLITVLIGFARHLQAPVLIGGGVLLVIALTQGGPFIGYLPGWLTIGTAGVILLVIGVQWERAITSGRRAAAWVAGLA
ncbi:hypothetical protein [Nocardioides sp.]|uniref:SCO7613 C-terminal domain-containing membrane protein n=1 Tax=Nocardioides sp. TaxID=35761 RepID=UPI00261C2A58|nr:hypothetical protein [Nocardioides sp.]